MVQSQRLTVNLMLLNGVAALSEAFADGRAGGLSGDQLRELLGNSPILKPASETAISAGVSIARIFEEAGLPPAC